MQSVVFFRELEDVRNDPSIPFQNSRTLLTQILMEYRKNN